MAGLQEPGGVFWQQKEERGGMEPELAHKIDLLAEEIFLSWDVERDGVVFSDDIINASDVHDEEFGSALGRVLCKDNSGKIYTEDLAACLKTLKYGSLENQITLLMKFMDRDCSGNISLTTIQSYLQISDEKLLDRLGLKSDKSNIQYEDMLGLFSKTERGPDAINVFCNQIIRILMKQTRHNRRRQNLNDHMSLKHFSLPRGHFTTLSVSLTSWFNQLIDFISVSSLTKSSLTVLQIFLWLLNVHYYHGRGKPLSFCFAKGFGLNLRVLTIILFVSMARTTLSKLSNIKFIKPFLFSGHNIQAHAFCGTCTFFHSFGHTIMHIYYQKVNREGGFVKSFEQPSLLGGFFQLQWNYGDNIASGDGFTGIILLLLIVLMTISSICRGRHSFAYRIFSRVHFLYNAWLVFIVLHVPHLWPYFLAVALLMIVDRGYDYFFLTLHSTLASSRPCSNGSTFLSIPYSQQAGNAGCYYRVKVPEISMLEWHPFSLASSESSHNLTFFVARNGDWTKKLHELVSDPFKRANVKCLVQGPFDSPAKEALKSPSSSVLLVASGIGITPFFSVMATKVTDEYIRDSDKQLYENLFNEDIDQTSFDTSNSPVMSRTSLGALICHDLDVRMLRVMWVIRDAVDLMFYVDYVYHLVKHQSNLTNRVVHVDVYLTGLGSSSDPTFMIAQTLFLLVISGQLSDHIQIRFGRPNMNKVVDNVNPDQVFFCGGRALKGQLKSICSDKKIKFSSENFDSSESVVMDTLSNWFSKVRGKGKKSFFTPRPSQQGDRLRYDSTSTGAGYSFSQKLSFW